MNQSPSFDWNLIRNFESLLLEGNVTRAAARIGITQSAMSRALGRLREIFDDELFIRSASGVEATPRALALSPKIHELCSGMSELARDRDHFDAGTAQRSFTIVSADYAEWQIMPALLSHLQKHAPGISIAFGRATVAAHEYLDDLETDLVFRPQKSALGALKSETLFDESFRCIVRKAHPRLGKRRPLTLESFCNESHVLIAPRGQAGGIVDKKLARLGKSRKVAARVPTFLVAPELVARTDLIATVPARLAEAYAPIHELRILSPPLSLPGFSMQQVWHARNDGDDAHKFLRKTIRDLF